MDPRKEILTLLEKEDIPGLVQTLNLPCLRTILPGSKYEGIGHDIVSLIGSIGSAVKCELSIAPQIQERELARIKTLLVPVLQEAGSLQPAPLKDIIPKRFNTLLLFGRRMEQLEPNSAWIAARMFTNIETNVRELEIQEGKEISCFPFIEQHENGLSAVSVANNGPQMTSFIFQNLGVRGVTTKGEERGIGLADVAESAGRYGLSLAAHQWDDGTLDIRDLTHLTYTKVDFDGNQISRDLDRTRTRREVQLDLAIHQRAQTALQDVGVNGRFRPLSVAFSITGEDQTIFHRE